MPTFLAGHKTYILAAFGAALTFAHAMEWIGTDVYQLLLGLTGAGAVATLRAGMKTTTAEHTATIEDKIAGVSGQVARVSPVVQHARPDVTPRGR